MQMGMPALQVQVVVPPSPGSIPPPQFGPIRGYENVPPATDSTPRAFMSDACLHVCVCVCDTADGAGAGVGAEALAMPAPYFLPPAPLEPAPAATRVAYTASTDATVREAMRAYCRQHLTYSKDPAINMSINAITPGLLYRVQLDTFLESRTVQWTIIPYEGTGTATRQCRHGEGGRGEASCAHMVAVSLQLSEMAGAGVPQAVRQRMARRMARRRPCGM
jgi:hypothetical protein